MKVNEFKIKSLISHVQEILTENHTEYLQQNPIYFLEISFNNENFIDLWDFFLKNLCKKFLNSDDFINLKEPLLMLMLKSDDLNVDEIEIWENLLKWIFVQQNINNDPTKWSKEDIKKLEDELQRFLPLIRFYDIKP